MRDALKTFLVAVQFFTRIPVTGALGRWVDYSPGRLNRAAACFPLVGFVVGIVNALAVGFAAALLQPLGALGWALAALMGLAVSVWLTGAFHEDGLADTFDALGGHVDRTQALAIMKDSRLGTYGTVALMMALSTKVLLVASVLSLDIATALSAMVVAHGASRLGPLVVMARLPYVGDLAASKAKPLAQTLSLDAALFAGVSTLLGIIACGSIATWWMGSTPWTQVGLHILVQLLGASALGLALASAGCVRWFRQRLGGFTGDCLGATQQLAELAIWMTLLVLLLAA
jgi:adenosylcobinamide-GDP ribazoletransferase